MRAVPGTRSGGYGRGAGRGRRATLRVAAARPSPTRSPAGRPAVRRPGARRVRTGATTGARRAGSYGTLSYGHRPHRARPRAADIAAATDHLLAANTTELTRADTKAAVLLGFLGAVLGVFVTVTRGVPSVPAGAGAGAGGAVGWWSAVGTALLAVGCFVGALAPRRRKGRADGDAGPGYFEQVAALRGERLGRAVARSLRDPVAPRLAALRRTSEIVRVKYRWIETGSVLLLVALPQLVAVLRPW